MDKSELLKKSTYFYDLPEELIAQDPLEKRDESRLLVLNKRTGKIEHKTFKNVIKFSTVLSFLNSLNSTKKWVASCVSITFFIILSYFSINITSACGFRM